LNNEEEFLSGTQPTNSASVLRNGEQPLLPGPRGAAVRMRADSERNDGLVPASSVGYLRHMQDG
jgi:hypothetical protein